MDSTFIFAVPFTILVLSHLQTPYLPTKLITTVVKGSFNRVPYVLLSKKYFKTEFMNSCICQIKLTPSAENHCLPAGKISTHGDEHVEDKCGKVSLIQHRLATGKQAPFQLGDDL